MLRMTYFTTSYFLFDICKKSYETECNAEDDLLHNKQVRKKRNILKSYNVKLRCEFNIGYDYSHIYFVSLCIYHLITQQLLNGFGKLRNLKFENS